MAKGEDGADGAIERRLDLDWIRIGAFAILILYHVGMYYVPWTWHVKSDRPVEWLQPAMALVNPWRLTLLFIVSGAASRFMLDKSGAWTFARQRAWRLAVPLIFGMAVIVPPQSWLEVAKAQGGVAMDYGPFYRLYLTGAGGWVSHGTKLVTPTWNHLWFVAYLLAYTLMLAAAVALWRGFPERASRLAGGLARWPGLALAAGWFSAVHLILAPRYPETHAFFADWTVHGQYLPAFLFGFAAARAPALWAGLERRRRLLAVAAAAAAAAYSGALALWIGGRLPPELAQGVMGWTFGIDQWLCAMAALALAAAHLRHFDPPWRRWLTEAIFPFYIVHQTLIILAARALRGAQLPVAAEAGAIVAITLTGCLVAYEVARRLAWLRPLFGLKRKRRPGVPPQRRRLPSGSTT